MAAVLLILEPILEADFEDCSYGFRPGRTAVYDADLAGYFDSIPQDKLIACVRMRVVDGSVLGLIRQWLKAPVVEPSPDGKPPTVRRNERGTPQGGVISPLLSFSTPNSMLKMERVLRSAGMRPISRIID